MSNVEVDPRELLCKDLSAKPAQLIQSRDVPLGGPRQMLVRRTLPARGLSLIGAWCFADHYGPQEVSATGGMRVPGHPHTGLQTVSWLFEGEIEHRDTAGFHALVKPGEVNIMTAGSGIAHSEYSTENTSVLHGLQLWVALPEEHRFTARRFDFNAPDTFDFGAGEAKILVGDFAGHSSPVPAFSELVGAELTFHHSGPEHTLVTLPLIPEYEYGVVVDRGTVSFRTQDDELLQAENGDLIYFGLGNSEVQIEISAKTRVMLLGGKPFGEKIVMWWNFIGRSHAEIEEFRASWQAEREMEPSSQTEKNQYGVFPEAWQRTLPAPELPNVRLRLRG